MTNVILNRVNSEKFPDTVDEVLNQNGQFSTVASGAIYRVEVSDELVDNVVSAYMNYDTEVVQSQDALYFTTGSFDRKYLFTDEVGHNFYR